MGELVNFAKAVLQEMSQRPRLPSVGPTESLPGGSPKTTLPQPALLNISQLQPGMAVWWKSPLFGEVNGIVALMPDHGYVCVRNHSVTKRVVFIPVSWVTRVQPLPEDLA